MANFFKKAFSYKVGNVADKPTATIEDTKHYIEQENRGLWIKFLSVTDSFMEENTNIEVVYNTFSHWAIFQSILVNYNQYGKMTKKQYAVFVKHFKLKLDITLPPYEDFTRGYKRKGKSNKPSYKHMWSKDVKSILYYDLPLESPSTVKVGVLETKGTQSLISIDDKVFKTHKLTSGVYEFRRTRHKGFLKLIGE